jgi:hypothetical protein
LVKEKKVLLKNHLISTIEKIENIVQDEYSRKNKTFIMEKNSCKCKSGLKGWGCWRMVSEKGTISGSLIQKIWWWISRKEVKLKFVIEMDETEVDDFFWEDLGWDASVFAGESLEVIKPKSKASNKQSKGRGKQEGETVRKSAKKNSTTRKKI